MVEEDSFSTFLAFVTIVHRFVPPLTVFRSLIVVLGYNVVCPRFGILHHELAKEGLLAKAGVASLSPVIIHRRVCRRHCQFLVFVG